MTWPQTNALDFRGDLACRVIPSPLEVVLGTSFNGIFFFLDCIVDATPASGVHSANQIPLSGLHVVPTVHRPDDRFRP